MTAKDDVHGSTSVTEDMDVVSDRRKYWKWIEHFPVQAGIHEARKNYWIPAFAGMTASETVKSRHQ